MSSGLQLSPDHSPKKNGVRVIIKPTSDLRISFHSHEQQLVSPHDASFQITKTSLD